MIVRLVAAALALLAAAAAPAHAQDGSRATLVVELFTSQGCTQCPRANRLLGSFAREEGVLALTFPVGIWDYLGWRDTFARPEFAERQRLYARALRARGRITPQLVLNGARQISASDWDEVRAIAAEQRRAGRPAGAPELSIARVRNRVRVSVGSGAAGGVAAEVWLVAYDPGPISVAITAGVNVNRTMAHYNLVRWIDRMDGWSGAPATYERTRCTPECAVIVQRANGGAVLAAAYTGRRRR